MPTSIDSKALAETAVAQQTRLREDAKKRLDAAAAARAKADLWLADATAAYDKALSDSAADRSSDALLDAAARCAVRRDQAQRDLDVCTRVHGENAKALEDAERNLSQAQAALKLEQAWDALLVVDGGAFEARTMSDAKTFVDGVTAIVGAVRSMREHITTHNEAVRKYHEAGGDPNVRPRDGSAHTGAIYAALHRAGGTLHDPNNPHALRYLCDVPNRHDAPLANVYENTRQLVGYLLQSLEQADRNDRAQLPTRGRAELLAAAAAFGSSRDRSEAARKLEVHDRASGEERGHRAMVEHAARLSAKAVFETRYPPELPRREDGSVIEAPPPVPALDAPPEDLTVG